MYICLILSLYIPNDDIFKDILTPKIVGILLGACLYHGVAKYYEGNSESLPKELLTDVLGVRYSYS